jgi:hypothetical protein
MGVIASLADPHGTRCVDVLQRDDGAFVFKEFRRDPEDAGRWTLIADHSGTAYPSKDAALKAAAAALAWFAAIYRSP